MRKSTILFSAAMLDTVAWTSRFASAAQSEAQVCYILDAISGSDGAALVNRGKLFEGTGYRVLVRRIHGGKTRGAATSDEVFRFILSGSGYLSFVEKPQQTTPPHYLDFSSLLGTYRVSISNAAQEPVILFEVQAGDHRNVERNRKLKAQQLFLDDALRNAALPSRVRYRGIPLFSGRKMSVGAVVIGNEKVGGLRRHAGETIYLVVDGKVSVIASNQFLAGSTGMVLRIPPAMEHSMQGPATLIEVAMKSPRQRQRKASRRS